MKARDFAEVLTADPGTVAKIERVVKRLTGPEREALLGRVMKTRAGWPGPLDGEALLHAVEVGLPSQPEQRVTVAEPQTARCSPMKTRRWPDPLGPGAKIGLVGEFLRIVAPHTEADEAALAIQLLVAFGSAVGRGPHFRVEADLHYGNEYLVLVGRTAKGRKGTSWGHVLVPFKSAAPEWAGERIISGLSTGEGLISSVRDPVITPSGTVQDPGISDKRLLVYEPEFASILRAMSRQGARLSTELRQAWDTGTLRVVNKNSPLKATDAHVSLIGHVTVDELRRFLDDTSLANGFANRLMFACSQRSRLLPEGGRIDAGDMERFRKLLDAALTGVRKLGDVELLRDEEARALWKERYESISGDRDGMLGSVTNRAEAHVVRLALLYALLNNDSIVRRAHLEAGLEVWRYCEESARYVFGDALGDPVADRLYEAMLNRGDLGMTLTEQSTLFGRNVPAERLALARMSLKDRGLAHPRFDEVTNGRPAERWCAGVNSSNSSNSSHTRGGAL